MSLRSFLLGAAALAVLPAAAQAATITVTPTLAPNIFGSPSYAAWVVNANQALHDGLSHNGDPTQPSYYDGQSSVTIFESIVTGFPSWKGMADPGTVFGPAFANELGNRMLFGLKIDGDGTQFSISQLSFSATSSDAGNQLGFSFGAGSYNYSSDYEGVLAGPDGKLWTSDDVYITSGPNTQLVDGLVGRGSGNSFDAYCPGCTVSQEQQAIQDATDYWRSQGAGTFTGTYALGASTGAATFSISAVPEPATWAMMMLGVGLIGASLRRRNLALRTA